VSQSVNKKTCRGIWKDAVFNNETRQFDKTAYIHSDLAVLVFDVFMLKVDNIKTAAKYTIEFIVNHPKFVN
jgi:hypothetical protein